MLRCQITVKFPWRNRSLRFPHSSSFIPAFVQAVACLHSCLCLGDDNYEVNNHCSALPLLPSNCDQTSLQDLLTISDRFLQFSCIMNLITLRASHVEKFEREDTNIHLHANNLSLICELMDRNPDEDLDGLQPRRSDPSTA